MIGAFAKFDSIAVSIYDVTVHVTGHIDVLVPVLVIVHPCLAVLSLSRVSRSA